jgi:salicylate hydroxylase
MGERQTIFISGGGIGGLSAALAVSRAGFNAVVAERAEQLAEIGAGIQLSPNAGRVLAGLGLDDAIARAAIEPVAIDIRSGPSGRLLASIPVDTFKKRYGFPYRVIHRADLQKILARQAERRGIDLRFGATVTDLLAKRGALLVKSQRPAGTDIVAASALIGADGVWSATRARVAGAGQPKLTGRTAWRALVPLDNAPPSLPIDRVGLWLGEDAHLVHYPVAQGAAINLVAIVEEPWDRQGWSAAGDRVRIAERFVKWSADARAIINAPFGWTKWAIASVDPDAPWAAGPVALLGDAAHAMTPFLAQGAAMAIEDADALGRALSAAPDAEAALKAYEAERKPRVLRTAKAAAWTGDVYHYARRRASLRDLALRFAGPGLILRQNDWLYGWPAA